MNAKKGIVTPYTKNRLHGYLFRNDIFGNKPLENDLKSIRSAGVTQYTTYVLPCSQLINYLGRKEAVQ